MVASNASDFEAEAPGLPLDLLRNRSHVVAGVGRVSVDTATVRVNAYLPERGARAFGVTSLPASRERSDLRALRLSPEHPSSARASKIASAQRAAASAAVTTSLSRLLAR